MMGQSLDRFAAGRKDPQDRPTWYRGPYTDPYDDGDWLEHMDEEKKRRFGLLEDEDE